MTEAKLQLGRETALPSSPEEAVLDRVPNPHPDTNYVGPLHGAEFTSLCPSPASRTSPIWCWTMCRTSISWNRSR